MKALLVVLGLLLVPAFSGEATKAAAPNILLLIGDDIDRHALGPWGGQAKTPHLDQLAKEGVTLDRVYANVAMCAPCRQELYSGRCVWRTRAIPNHSRSKPGTRSLPHYLRPLGYQVGLLGKGHIGPRECYPFDKLGDFPKNEDNNPVILERTRAYIDKARKADKRFCLVIAAHDGHGPYTNGDPSAYDPAAFTLPADAIDTPAYRKELAAHFAEVTHLDALLGSLRKLLAREPLTRNTLVIYCSEQGSAFPFGKWTCFDDGLASGIVAALPGAIPAGHRSAQMTWFSDIAPTLIEVAGGVIDPKQFDGRSQWANWTGGDEKVHHYAYGAFTNCRILDNKERVFPIRSIRNKRYSLIWSPRATEDITSNLTLSRALELVRGKEGAGAPDTGASWVLQARKSGAAAEKQLVHRLHHRPEWGLYELQKDPQELTNLADNPAHAAAFRRLQKDLMTWLTRWDDADPVATERGFLP